MTYWIGRIEPSMWFEGAWWQEILPPDVRLAVLSLGVQRLVDEDLERAHAAILEKVAMLDAEGVDVINVGGSPVVSVHGRAGHQRLLDDIAAITNRPYVTSLQAEVEGLREAGAGRVAIASPYPVRQTEKRVTVLTEEGFEVVGHESLDIERTREIAQLDPERVLDQAVRVAERYPTADVLYLPCGSLPVTSIIDAIEHRTGMSVITNVQAQVAANLRRLNYPQPIRGYGRLLETIAPAA
ncbi:MAG: maleate cis-trans isomerase family protein [Candidatus Limnocylindria bacterium]